MAFDFIFRNAKIVTPAGIIEGDVGISAGKIAAFGKISDKAVRERDCTGLFILPGAIDMHVHFRDPGFPEKEDFASGSRAAAAGGVTTVIDMPNTNPPTLTCADLEVKRAIAKDKSRVNFGFYMGLAYDNLAEIKNAKNIAGVKVYMGSTTGDLLMQDKRVIEELFKLGKFVIVHAEDENIIRANQEKYKDSMDNPGVHSLIRGPEAAYEATKAVLYLAKKCNARVHITHVSTGLEAAELKKFKGPLVSADCAPHHLYLSQSAYGERGNYVKMNPPLRTNEDRQALWKALKEGVIQTVATDHAPHAKAEKEQPYGKAPSGVPGEETLLPLLLDSVNHGELSLQDVARLTSENPAALLGIRGKGKIEVGFDADFAVIDMNKEQEVGKNGYFTKCGWSPFGGWKLKGWPVMTVVGGKVVCENGKIDETVRGAEVVLS